MTNIAVNGRPLHFPFVGTGVYLRNLLLSLSSLNTEIEFDVITNAPVLSGCFGNDIKITTTGGPIEIASLKGQTYWEQVLFPHATRSIKPDLVHVPYLGGSYINFAPQVLTVFDLIPYRFAEAAPSTLGLKTYFKIQAAVLKKVSRIITTSDYSKRDIIDRFKLADEQVKVTYLAPDPSFRVIDCGEKLHNIKEKYGLSNRFIFYAGGTDRRKNIQLLLDAYQQLRADIQGEFQLVILGNLTQHDPYQSELLQRIHNHTKEPNIRVIPRVELEDLVLLYNAASIFVYPSVYEGFGLPPLEAMACGTPVVASSATSIPEVVGSAGLLFDPSSSEDLATSLAKVLTDEDLAKSLVEKGLVQSKLFTWRNTAMQTLDVYRGIVPF